MIEFFILYIVPMLISWIFLLSHNGVKSSGVVILMVSIIPILNIIGAIAAISVVMNHSDR